jgi:hypothetical protein
LHLGETVQIEKIAGLMGSIGTGMFKLASELRQTAGKAEILAEILPATLLSQMAE